LADPFPLPRSYQKSAQSESSPPSRVTKEVGVVIGLLISGIPILGGIGIIGLQNYAWLRKGYWPPLCLLGGLQILFTSSWLTNPRDWLGLQSVLSKISLSVALLAIGYCSFWMAFLAEE
jgi:hypothetical protein